MALNFKDLVTASREYSEAERAKGSTDSISSDQLKDLMKQSIAMGGDVNANMLKLYDEMKKQTSLFLGSKKDATAVAEINEEASKVEKEQTDALKKIVENTDPKNTKAPKKEEGLGLGAIVAGITAALAGLAGVVAGYVKSIKLFLDVLTPEFIKTKIAKTFASIEQTIAEFGGKLKTIFGKGVEKISAFFETGLTKLKALFTFDDTSVIGKMISKFKSTFSGFGKLVAPFTEAFQTVKNLMTGTAEGLEFVGGISKTILGTVGDIKTWVSKIAGLFKGVFSVVSKLATPLFVIMTLWDTVSNVIDRFQSDGIIGAFVGIFEGLFKSIVAAPLDLIKDIASWVLGAFGFDKAEQFLDSFSFVDIVTGFVDALLHPIDTIVNMLEGVGDLVDEYIVQPLADAFAPITDFFTSIKDSVVGFFEAIEIPKIGFTIPIIDKEVSIGPFYPFKRSKKEETPASAPEGNVPAGRAGSPSANIAAREAAVATQTGANSVSGAGVKQDMLVPAGVAIPQATGPETRAQTEERVRGALRAGVEEKQAEVRVIESGVTVNGAPAATSRQDYYKQQGFTPEQISNLNSKQAKIDALKSQDPNVKIDKDLAIADSQVAVLQKEAETNRTSSLAIPSATQKPSVGLIYPEVPTPTDANAVYGASAENATAATIPSGGTTNNVVAPTTVNNTTNTTSGYKPDVRNQDSSFKRMLDNRYVPV